MNSIWVFILIKTWQARVKTPLNSVAGWKLSVHILHKLWSIFLVRRLRLKQNNINKVQLMSSHLQNELIRAELKRSENEKQEEKCELFFSRYYFFYLFSFLLTLKKHCKKIYCIIIVFLLVMNSYSFSRVWIQSLMPNKEAYKSKHKWSSLTLVKQHQKVKKINKLIWSLLIFLFSFSTSWFCEREQSQDLSPKADFFDRI